MHKLQTLTDGCCTRITLLINGEETGFRLAVAQRTDLWSKQKEYFFVYVSSDHKWYCDSFYSGGNTGVGANISNLKPYGDIDVLSDDLEEIKELGVRQDELNRQEQDRREKARATAVELINALPAKHLIGTFEGRKIWVERGEASYRPGYSNRTRPWIRGSYIVLHNDGTTSREMTLNPNAYITRDGKFRRKKAIADFGPQAAEIFGLVKAKIDEVNASITRILNDCEVN